MRNIKELGNAFGKADNAFVDNVYHTLGAIQKKQVRRPVINKKLRFVAAAAIVCILLTGVALAATNTWGVLDFLHNRDNSADVLPQANEIIQTNIPQAPASQAPTDQIQASQAPANTDVADFSVREAIYDGNNFYLIVDVKPVSSSYLLLGPDIFPQDYMSNMGPLFSDKTDTIADYAADNGKEMIQTNAGVAGVNGQGLEYLLQQDGTLTYMIHGSLIDDADNTELELTCIVAPFENQGGKEVILQDNIQRSSLNITLENTGISELVSSIAPAEYLSCGVRIDNITLKASEMAVYTEIRYTVIDEAKFAATDTGLAFEFLDPDGNSLPFGGAAGGETIIEDNIHYVVKSSIGAMETLPQEIAVRGYNIWDKNRYETNTFELR